jgi:hypothetical protein
MPQFFDLPRELRDMIYTEVITSQLPTPKLSSTQYASSWCRPWEPKSGLGNNGCAFSSRRAPNTCANFLACNRQINEEMTFALARARRKGNLAARMDCIAKDEMHWFTWLSIPLVRTTPTPSSSPSSKILPEHIAPRFLGRYLPLAFRARLSTTTIEQLQIDIRLFECAEKREVESPRDRISWAICAALKHVFEHDADIIPTRDCTNYVCIGEVILNILPQPQASSSTSSTSTSKLNPEQQQKQELSTEAVARDLVNVWNTLWSGDEFKARYYHCLLERIGRVRVMIQGKTWRVREVGVELERGKRERRRIEMRGGGGW